MKQSPDVWFTVTKFEMEDFMEYWKYQSSLDPVNFPNELEPGEWDEQFKIWVETIGTKE